MDRDLERASSVNEEKVSALLDDELSEFEFAAVLRAMDRDPALRATWERYQIIRTSVRRELADVAPTTLAEHVARRVAAEAPAGRWSRGIVGSGWPALKTASALAIAASVAAVAIIAVRPSFVADSSPVTIAQQTRSLQTPTAGSPDSNPKAVASARDSALNAMLVKHGEFSPTVGMSGLAPYVRVVGYPGNK
jgi:sigma-E factor negative regulatory protein RseA